MEVHASNLSYTGGRGRRITVQGIPEQQLETLSEKQTKLKRTVSMAGSNGRALAK
jgi:hypothetical protein